MSERFRHHTSHIFERLDIDVLGYWTTDVGPTCPELVYLLAFEDGSARQDAWQRFRTDSEWRAVVERTNAGGGLVASMSNRLLVPTDYSKLR
jgi:hypothetical protein